MTRVKRTYKTVKKSTRKRGLRKERITYESIGRPRRARVDRIVYVAPPGATKNKRKVKKGRSKNFKKSGKARGTRANAYEPALKPNNPNVAVYGRRMMELPSKLNPSVKFALACLNPAGIRSPFVENGVVFDAPTQVLNGTVSYDVPVLPADTDNFMFIAVTGCANTLFNATAPLNFYYRNSSASTISLANVLSGAAFNTLYGPTTYADRMIPYSSQLNIEILTTAAQLQGVVHIGSLSVCSWGNATIADLKTRAVKHVDLKEGGGRIVNLRAAIQNIAAIHKDIGVGTSTDGINDELISYAIFENVSSGIGTGTPLPYRVVMNMTTHAMWWPDGAQPALTAVAQPNESDSEPAITARDEKTREKEAVDKDVAEENAILLRKMNHVPYVLDNISNIVQIAVRNESLAPLLGSMNLVSAGCSTGTPASKASLTGVVVLAPQIEDDLISLNWESRWEMNHLHFPFWSPEALTLYDEIQESRDQLIAVLDEETQQRRRLHNRIQAAREEVIWHRGKRTTRYWEGEHMIDLDRALASWEREIDRGSSHSFEDSHMVHSQSKMSKSPQPTMLRGGK